MCQSDRVTLEFDRYCTEIVAQTDAVRSILPGADLTTPVPSCPGWVVWQLLRHLGGAQRWAAAAVSARVQEPMPEDEFAFRTFSEDLEGNPSELDPWLAEGAEKLASALRGAGPGASVWTPVPAVGIVDFYARRFTHETLIHRADATLALGAEFTADPRVATDAFDEWLELGSLPMMLEHNPRTRELLGPGRTLHFHATDTPPDLNAEWVVDLTGAVITWRRVHERAAVAVRGPLTDLLLLIYRRLTPDAAGVEILGDRDLFDFWLDRVGFG